MCLFKENAIKLWSEASFDLIVHSPVLGDNGLIIGPRNNVNRNEHNHKVVYSCYKCKENQCLDLFL